MRNRMSRSALVSLLSTLLSAGAASAQSVDGVAFSGDRLRPATTRAGVLDVEWGGIGQHLQVDAALWGSYAHDPVVVFRGGDRLPLVAHRLGTNLTGNIAVFDRLELLLDVPVLLWQTGVDVPPSVASGTIATAGPGDLRLAPKLGLLNSRD
ncbi:MAG TPA: hypothetical protein VGF99_07895, partial [Myxococcota bacterium]